MSAAVQVGSAQDATAKAFLSRHDGLASRVPDNARRAAATALFRERGLPTLREEAWHYTSMRALAGTVFSEPLLPVGDEGKLAAQLPDLDVPRAVFVDGRFNAKLSSLPDGVTTGAPADGKLARPDRERIVALSEMLAEDGLTFTVPAGVDAGTLMLVSIGTDAHGRPVSFHPRHRIELAAGARLALLEVCVGEGTYLHAPVMEATVAAKAHLTHVRLQREASTAFHLSTLYTDVAEDAAYESFTLVAGARLARAEIHARLSGPRASVTLNGAQLLGGQQHADITTVVAHDAPGCASRQTIKHVVTDRARGVFQGRIEVARIAQKTDGYQMNQALLLSEHAEVDCKPQLEIYADDVKCSHGATIGALDPEQVFYLRARGIPLDQARALLVRAFLSEALDPVAHEAGRELLETAVADWWSARA